MNKTLVLALLLVLACGHPAAPADSIVASPDHQHAIFYSEQGTVRSIDAATGLEVGRATNLDPFEAPFSADGAVMLAPSLDGHLITFRVADGRTVDLGPSLDRGILSADGKWVVYSAAISRCISGVEHFECADIYAVSSAGGTPKKIGSGLRVLGLVTTRINGVFDSYSFAGNDFVFFTDNEGSLYSTPVDGSAQPVLVAPKVGDAEANGLPVAPFAFAVRGVPKLFYMDAAGAHVADPDGRNAVFLGADEIYPSCNSGDSTYGLHCGLGPDGKTLLFAANDPVEVVSNGVVSSNQHGTPGFRLRTLSIDDPAAPGVVIPSQSADFFFNGDGDLIFYDTTGLLKRTADGTQTRIFPLTRTTDGLTASLGVLSPDHRWIAVQQHEPSGDDSCPDCATFLSLSDGTLWTVADALGPVRVSFTVWSPDSTRLLLAGLFDRFGPDDEPGVLGLVSVNGKDLKVIDDNVDDAVWIDAHHVAIQRRYSHGRYPAGTFIREIP